MKCLIWAKYFESLAPFRTKHANAKLFYYIFSILSEFKHACVIKMKFRNKYSSNHIH